jgi:hypothetical protein
MTLYLCKLDPTKIESRTGEPQFVAVIGRIIRCRITHDTEGYRFIPNTSSHRASRKTWPTANSCIPKWTEKFGFLRLYTYHELDLITRLSDRRVSAPQKARG